MQKSKSKKRSHYFNRKEIITIIINVIIPLVITLLVTFYFDYKTSSQITVYHNQYIQLIKEILDNIK